MPIQSPIRIRSNAMQIPDGGRTLQSGRCEECRIAVAFALRSMKCSI